MRAAYMKIYSLNVRSQIKIIEMEINLGNNRPIPLLIASDWGQIMMVISKDNMHAPHWVLQCICAVNINAIQNTTNDIQLQMIDDNFLDIICINDEISTFSCIKTYG